MSLDFPKCSTRKILERITPLPLGGRDKRRFARFTTALRAWHNSPYASNPASLRSWDNSPYASNVATLVFSLAHYLPSAVTKGIIAIIRERFIAMANSL